MTCTQSCNQGRTCDCDGKASDLIKALRGELLDCNCCAYSSNECCCDTVWPEQVTREALIQHQAAEINRLTVELNTERCLSFRDQVAKLEAELANEKAAHETWEQEHLKECAKLHSQLTETRDLAEHWAILAEQRRVELGELRQEHLDHLDEYMRVISWIRNRADDGEIQIAQSVMKRGYEISIKKRPSTFSVEVFSGDFVECINAAMEAKS